MNDILVIPDILPPRPSHCLWQGCLAVGDSASKALIPLVMALAVKVFSTLYSQVFAAKSLGLFLGSFVNRCFNTKRLHLLGSSDLVPYHVHFLMLATFSELSLASLSPIHGIALSFASGFVTGLSLDPLIYVEQQSTEKERSAIFFGDIP